MVEATVLVDVFDPRIREVDVPVKVGEVVVGGPLLNLGWRAIRTAVAVAATAIPLLQESLVLAV